MKMFTDMGNKIMIFQNKRVWERWVVAWYVIGVIQEERFCKRN